MSDYILQAKNLTRKFGGFYAVGGESGLSFDVKRGSIVGLIGPNGAGKSTTFNLISGVLKPTSGSVSYNGRDLNEVKTSDIASLGLSRTFQTPRAFPTLSLIENIIVGAHSPGEHLVQTLLGGWKLKESDLIKRAESVLEQVGLSHQVNQDVTNLSGGELRMLEVARQLIRDPEILLLDEPTAGVDPALQNRLLQLLVDLNQDGKTLIIVEHNLHFLMELADHVIVLQNGGLLAEGSPEDIKSNKLVVSAYLGDEHAA